MKPVASPAAFGHVFEEERSVAYPSIDAIEARCGYAVGVDRLLDAARVLACPVKANRPNWQHGRVIYSLTRHYLDAREGPVTLLDIGTAKGFSALCLEWARVDAGVPGAVHSVDVLDPDAAVRRNTVAECDGLKTLRQILAPWPESQQIEFRRMTGVEWLRSTRGRVHVAYVDGKHDYPTVAEETRYLAGRQETGDVVLWDDYQIPGVAKAVLEAGRDYEIELVAASSSRLYAIGRRR